MSTLKVNEIEPYSGGTVTITGGTIDSASFAQNANTLTPGTKTINGALLVTGDTQITGSLRQAGQTFRDQNVYHSIDDGGYAQYIMNPDYYTQFYGQVLVWGPNEVDSGGRSAIYLNEKGRAEVDVNAYSGSYDNRIKIKADSTGVSFNDWSFPTYGDQAWMRIQQDGPPRFLRDVEVTGSLSVTEAVKLTPQDPLPVGTVGDLAVSGSNLYFYNGAWTQVI